MTLIREIEPIPNNPNGAIHPDQIDWETVDVKKDINWREIDFLVVEERDGKQYLKRHPKVPQIGGLGAILSYQGNLCRFMRTKVNGGEEFIEKCSEYNILFDISLTLTNGGELPLN